MVLTQTRKGEGEREGVKRWREGEGGGERRGGEREMGGGHRNIVNEWFSWMVWIVWIRDNVCCISSANRGGGRTRDADGWRTCCEGTVGNEDHPTPESRENKKEEEISSLSVADNGLQCKVSVQQFAMGLKTTDPLTELVTRTLSHTSSLYSSSLRPAQQNIGCRCAQYR